MRTVVEVTNVVDGKAEVRIPALENVRGGIELDDLPNQIALEVRNKIADGPVHLAALVNPGAKDLADADLHDWQIVPKSPGYTGKPEVDHMRLRELISGQYQDALGILELSHEKDIAPPQREEATRIFSEQLSPEQLQVILEMKKPVFTLEPFISFQRILEVANRNNALTQMESSLVNVVCGEHFSQVDAAQGLNQNISGWRIAFDEGTPYLDEDPELTGRALEKKVKDCKHHELHPRPLYEQYRLWKARQPEGVVLVNPRRYALMQLRAIRKGEPLDFGVYSTDGSLSCAAILDDERGELDGNHYIDGFSNDPKIIIGHWYQKESQLVFASRRAVAEVHFGRFRQSVVKTV